MKSCIHSIKSLISYGKTAFFTPGGPHGRSVVQLLCCVKPKHSSGGSQRQRYSFNRYGVAFTALKALSPPLRGFHRCGVTLTSRSAAINRVKDAFPSSSAAKGSQ